MPAVGFEPTVSAGERPKTYALDRAATGTGLLSALVFLKYAIFITYIKVSTICVRSFLDENYLRGKTVVQDNDQKRKCQHLNKQFREKTPIFFNTHRESRVTETVAYTTEFTVRLFGSRNQQYGRSSGSRSSS